MVNRDGSRWVRGAGRPGCWCYDCECECHGEEEKPVGAEGSRSSKGIWGGRRREEREKKKKEKRKGKIEKEKRKENKKIIKINADVA